MEWSIKKFDELSLTELYSILQLRSEVFVVEQNCVYQDMDNKDQKSLHLLGKTDNKLVAYTRLIPAGISYTEPSIGRVVTSPSCRKQGVGRELMLRSINACYRLFGETTIKIGAQRYLENFYSSLGFITCSNEYLEDGIPHVEMIRKPTS